jgi:gamma-tubulin complex component 5
MALRFRDALAADVGEAPKIAQSSTTRAESRFHHSRREQGRRKVSAGFARSSRGAALVSDSESDLEEEEALRHGLFGSHYHNVPPVSRDGGRQLFGDIYEMQGELDKLVRFVRREVEGLAGGTSGTASTFSVLAFALEDWGR